THLRKRLASHNVITTAEALTRPSGTRVTVAGLNIRPHRPPTRSGKPVLFTSVEDEMDLIQIICVGEAITNLTSTFLTAPAVLVRGKIERRGNTVSLLAENARLLRIQDFLEDSVQDSVQDPQLDPQQDKAATSKEGGGGRT